MEANIKQPRTIKLDLNLFFDLYLYAYRHSDPDDLQYQRVTAGVRKKLETLLRHDIYTAYKTGASRDERKRARDKYLDSIGMSDDFRWPDDYDINIKPIDIL